MFRFTIRDVLWLTVVAALAVGWWIDRRHYVADAEKARAEKQEAIVRSDSEVRKRNAKFAEDLRRDVLAGRIGVVPQRVGRLMFSNCRPALRAAACGPVDVQ